MARHARASNFGYGSDAGTTRFAARESANT